MFRPAARRRSPTPPAAARPGAPPRGTEPDHRRRSRKLRPRALAARDAQQLHLFEARRKRRAGIGDDDNAGFRCDRQQRLQGVSGTPSKKSTTPVSREYSAPDHDQPLFPDQPLEHLRAVPEVLAEARMFARTAAFTSASRSCLELGREQPLERRTHAVDDRLEVAGLALRRLPELLQGGEDRAALGMAEHHHQPRAEARRRELDAADLRRGHDVAGHADDEQVAEALVEHDLRRHARVRAAKHDGERLLGVCSSARRVELRKSSARRCSRRTGGCPRAAGRAPRGRGSRSRSRSRTATSRPARLLLLGAGGGEARSPVGLLAVRLQSSRVCSNDCRIMARLPSGTRSRQVRYLRAYPSHSGTPMST